MKTYLSLILLLFSFSSYAGPVNFEAGKVVKVYGGYGDGGLFFTTDGKVKNPAGCSSTTESRPLYGFDPENSNVDHALSLLLAAQASNRSVEIRVRDDSCFNGYTSVIRIAIY